jgi:hypothetical protein
LVGSLTWPVATAAADSPCYPLPSFPGAASFQDGQGSPNKIDNSWFALEPGTVLLDSIEVERLVAVSKPNHARASIIWRGLVGGQ